MNKKRNFAKGIQCRYPLRFNVRRRVGIMPIRVLQHNLIGEFENMNPQFLELAQRVINGLGLYPGIGYDVEEERAKSPNVLFEQIRVQEPFLSYVWCMCFSLSVLYSESIVKQSINQHRKKKIRLNRPLARHAYMIWEYAMALLNDYYTWPDILPSPERYPRQYRQLIPKINGLYVTAMKYVLAHEFAHIELQHTKADIGDMDPTEASILQERQADARAIELVLEGGNNKNTVTIRMGLLIGLCSILFTDSTAKKLSYPDTNERIDAILQIITPDAQDAMWGVATLAYKLWDRHFDNKLKWIDGLESPEALYHNIREQVEVLNARKSKGSN